MTYKITYHIYGEEFKRTGIPDEQTARNEALSLKCQGGSEVIYTQEVA
jgi:hypothetical protein